MMTDQNHLFTPDLSMSLLSKSSPSQFPQFQFNNNNNNNRTRIQPEPFYSTLNIKPSNLSHVPCKFFKQGTCTAGANCTFSHSATLSSEAAVCKYFLKGNCKFGTKCALLHTLHPLKQVQQQQTFNNNLMIAMTPPNQSNLLDYQPMIPSNNHLLFGTSAPAMPYQEQLWHQRNNNNSSNNIITSDYINSPHESSSIDYLLGTSPFSNNQRLTSFASPFNIQQQQHQHNQVQQQWQPHSLQSSSNYLNHYQSNHSLLPPPPPPPSSNNTTTSFKNDFFTPNELQSNSKVPFFNNFNPTSKAINIPNAHHDSFSTHLISEQKNKTYLNDDDEVQFDMDEDEEYKYDHEPIEMINNTKAKNGNNTYHFTSLLSTT